MVNKAFSGSTRARSRPRSPVTYDKATYVAAKQAWIDGEFGPEWAPYQRAAAEGGFIYPPNGTRWDDPYDDEPSQRAIIHQAIEERPAETLAIIGRSSSWSDAIDRISGMRSRVREDADFAEKDARYEQADRPTYRESLTALADILRRIDDSRPA